MLHIKSIVANNDRAPGPTFDPGAIGWLDFETRGKLPIDVGSYRYATEADAIVLAWAIGDGPINTAQVSAFDGPLRWDQRPDEISDHHKNVAAGNAIWAAWNAGFDRAIWNYATLGFPELEPDHIIDVMAQASAAGLPPDLSQAARASKSIHKQASGRDLIKLFCLPESTATPQSHPEQWRAFLQYAGGDIESMRAVFRCTRQLPRAEWQEYWAMEAINQRGARIDVDMVNHAAELAAQDRSYSSDEIKELTGGDVRSVDEVARMTRWLLDHLPLEGRTILLKREEEIDEEGKTTRVAEFQLTRQRVQRLIALCQSEGMASPADVLRVLQLRLYGGSKTPTKFNRMRQQHVEGILRGQYVFNGAGQTGRASSRGVQIHNLARDTLKNEPDLIDALLSGANYDVFSALGPDPVARKLSLLIRPAFVASEGNAFIWSDWSQIEARIVPWLCDHMPGARARLQIFKDVDEHPELPDLYTRTAASIFGLPIAEVTDQARQRGKIAELALGFCGGVGALQNMASGYGVHMSDQEAQHIVNSWRNANPWAIEYSRELWSAMLMAFEAPGFVARAGRAHFVFLRDYLEGSLLCVLPSGRCLTYRAMHWQSVDVLNDDGEPTGKKRQEMTFARGYGRIKLWPGLFVENITQATAADCLRGTLARLEVNPATAGMVRLHTHDEVVLETYANLAPETSKILRFVMCAGFPWTDGLPLRSEETIGYAYTKHKGSHGL